MSKTILTRKQREIIVGKLLGDGCLETRNNGRTYRLKIEHSHKQREYVKWLYGELKNIASSAPKERSNHAHGKTYKKSWFNTISTGMLRFYGKQFYKDKKKNIPKYIHKWLTPISLAVWYMDDGSIKSKETKGRILNTQGFNKKDIQILQKALQDNFSLSTRLRIQKEGYQIFIPASEYEKLMNTIKDYVIPSMKYKL